VTCDIYRKVPICFINALTNNVTKDLSDRFLDEGSCVVPFVLLFFGAAYHISSAKVCQVDANLLDLYQMQMLYTILRQDRTLVSCFILISDGV